MAIWNCWQFIFVQEFKLWYCWFAAKLMRGWNWSWVQWASLLVCGGSAYWGQLTPGRCDSYWSQMQPCSKDDFVSAGLSSGPQGGSRSFLVWSRWSREGWMRNRPSTIYLSLSPQKPGKHCPGATAELMWALPFVCFWDFWLVIKHSLCSVRQIRKGEQHKRNKPGSEIFPPKS